MAELRGADRCGKSSYRAALPETRGQPARLRPLGRSQDSAHGSVQAVRARIGTPLPAQPGSLGLKRRLALHHGLGKRWLPPFPRLPPLSACRAEPLLEAPLAKRVKAAHPKVSFVSDTCSVTGSRGLTCGSGGLYRHGNDSKTSFV